MLTLLGIKQLKIKLIKLGQKNDPEINAILQQAVDDVNIVKKQRFTEIPPTP